MDHSTGLTEQEQKRKSRVRRTMTFYFSEGLSQRQRKFVSALLRWRYGLTERVFNADEANIVVAATESEVSSLTSTVGLTKLILPGYDLVLLRQIGDSSLSVSGDAPRILLPYGDDWLNRQLSRRGYKVKACDEIASILVKFNQVRNFEQQEQLRTELGKLLLDSLEDIDYVVVTERGGPLHFVIAAFGSVIGKPVIAEAVSPILLSLADSFVSRREDLIALVDAVTGYSVVSHA